MKPRASMPSTVPGNRTSPATCSCDESGVRLVGVEGADHVIAIGPGVGARLVLVVAVRFAVMHHVQPVPGPALAVLGRGQQPIDQLLVGQGIGVGHKRIDLRPACGGKADQVEIEPPNQRPPVGGRRGSSRFSCSRASTKASIGPRTQGESNFGTGGRTSGSSDHQRGIDDFLVGERQAVGPRGAGRDPAADGLDLAGRQRRSVFGHFGFVARDVLDEQTLVRLAGHDRRSAFAAGQRRRASISEKLPLGLLPWWQCKQCRSSSGEID